MMRSPLIEQPGLRTFWATLVMLMVLLIASGEVLSLRDAFAGTQNDKTTQEIKSIQAQLTLMGYTLTVDGKNGAETQKALTTFTKDFNVTPKGDVTDLSGHTLSYYTYKTSYYGAIAKTNSELRGIVTGAIVVGKKPFLEWASTQTKCNGESTTHITRSGTRSQKIDCYLKLLTAYQSLAKDTEDDTAVTQASTEETPVSATPEAALPTPTITRNETSSDTNDNTLTASSTPETTKESEPPPPAETPAPTPDATPTAPSAENDDKEDPDQKPAEPVMDPGGTTPATPTAPLTAFDKRFEGREQDISSLKVESPAIWTPQEGCACVPNLATITYGFYPLASGGLSVNFGLFSRIGYNALGLNSFGNFVPETFGTLNEASTSTLKAFTQMAHRYGTKVDLVISHEHVSAKVQSPSTSESEEQSGLPIVERSYVLLNLIDTIVAGIEDCECDGVTIDFSNVPSTLNERYRFFLKRLYKRLKERDTRLSLNVVMPNTSASSDRETTIGNLTKALEDLSPSVDLFLADWGMKDPMIAALGHLEQDIKVALVLSGENITRTNYELARNNLSGVGIWNLSAKPSDWEPLLQTGIDQAIAQVELGTVKQLLPQIICNLVCPNRDIVRLILFTVLCLILALFIASFWIYEIRKIAKQHIYIVIAIVGLFAVLLWLLTICVPLWTGIRIEFTIALLLGFVGVMIKASYDKKRAANYP